MTIITELSTANRLKAPFPYSSLEFKPQQVGWHETKGPWALLATYVSARAAQDRLDSAFGVTGWKMRYKHLKSGTMCGISTAVYMGNPTDKIIWVTKWDGADPIDKAIFKESFKGDISNAFKRTASAGYGIGRYLYDLPTIWAKSNEKWFEYGQKALTKDKKPFYWAPPSEDELREKAPWALPPKVIIN